MGRVVGCGIEFSVVRRCCGRVSGLVMLGWGMRRAAVAVAVA